MKLLPDKSLAPFRRPLDWLHYTGQIREGHESEEGPMADPKRPRHFSDDIKRQIVELINAEKPKSEGYRKKNVSGFRTIS
jgi:hypothetical protein